MARSGCFDVSRGDSDVTLRYTLHFGVTHNLAIPPSGDRRRIPPALVNKVERILARLDVAAQPGDMDLPG